MPLEITMPQLGLTMEQGTIVRWLVAPGDTVEPGQEILEVETDKAVVAVEAREGGVVARILVEEGRQVPVGTVVAVTTAPGETLPAGWLPSSAAQIPPEDEFDTAPDALTLSQPGVEARGEAGSGPLRASWKARALAGEAGLDLASLAGSGPAGRVVAADVAQALAAEPAPVEATPVASRLAEALGLDLAALAGRGSGPGGRLGQEDVLAAAAAIIRGQPGPARGQRISTPPAGLPQVAEVVPLRGVRGIVSQGMARSAGATARVTLFRRVDASALIRLRSHYQANPIKDGAVTYNDLLIYLCARALAEFPAANARLGEGQVEILDRINVGLAVETERGLLVPVVRDADRRSVRQIAAERARLVEAARTGRIPPDDLAGGTFTITNLGMYGVEGFTPVINLPECCILGVGQIVRQPVALDALHEGGDVVAVRPMMTLSLVFDHRVIDGAPAARFLERVAELINDPLWLMVEQG